MALKGLFVYAELDYRIHFEALGVSASHKLLRAA